MRKVKTPQTFTELLVVDTADKGRSVAKTPDGQVIFLEGAVPGDVVNVRTTRKKKNFFEGVVTEIKEPSPYRTVPKCVHFGVCGGCKWQNMSYERQLYFKEKEVAQNIERIGHTQALTTIPIAGCP
jgi:23S rRNA (uracil1939-C5)-methyltransferase